MIEKKLTELIGCYELQPTQLSDKRGKFVKIFQTEIYSHLGLQTDFREDYYSISKKNVVRGMHFQMPPLDQEKLVYCVQGLAVDVVTDLRIGSPTFGRSMQREISVDKGNIIYIPKGFAHGFCALVDGTILMYKVSTTYNQATDSGILWNSIGIKWPVSKPILSSRDGSFESFDDFKSPFTFTGT